MTRRATLLSPLASLCGRRGERRCKCGKLRFSEPMRYGWANQRGELADYHSISECQSDVTIWAQEDLEQLMRQAGLIT